MSSMERGEKIEKEGNYFFFFGFGEIKMWFMFFIEVRVWNMFIILLF